jgi:drug/metabolite transporter (DMT)-like permease
MTEAWTIGLLLAASSAICWTVVDIARKHIGAKMSASVAVTGLMLAQLPFILPTMIAATAGAKPDSDARVVELLFVEFVAIDASYLWFAVASVLLNIFANWLFLRAVQVSPLSLTTPYLSFTPVFSALVAFLWLGEQVTNWGIAGIMTVCVGAFFLNPGTKGAGLLAPFKALWSERGSFYMLIVAIVWSVTPILDKRASVQTSPIFHTLFLAAGIGVAFAVWQIGRGHGARLVRELKLMPVLMFVGGAMLVGAMVMQLSSYAYVEIAYVETIKRALGVVGAMAAGYLIFGEKDISRRFLGAAVMVVGVAMVLFGGN